MRRERAGIERDSWGIGKDDGRALASYGRSRGWLPFWAVSRSSTSQASDYSNEVSPFPDAG